MHVLYNYDEMCEKMSGGGLKDSFRIFRVLPISLFRFIFQPWRTADCVVHVAAPFTL